MVVLSKSLDLPPQADYRIIIDDRDLPPVQSPFGEMQVMDYVLVGQAQFLSMAP